MRKNLFFNGHSFFKTDSPDENESMCYWSSTTSSDADSAFGISFDGNSSDDPQRIFKKDQKLWIRPVKAF